MNQTIYKQLDSRWSKLPYPTKNSTFGANGCGCCACTHIAIEQDSKRNWNPTVLRKWMVAKGYAVAGKGTLWSGITETLKYIGHKSVVWVQRKDPMSMAWKELNKGNRIGVLLVDNSRTPDRTYWTSSGHYVAFTDYKITDDGKHWFYVKDSGSRNHSGWYCYEKSIRGALPQLWIVEKLGSVSKKTIDELAKEVINGKWGTGDERKKRLTEAGYDYDVVQKKVNEMLTKESWVDKANAWAKKIAADNTYHYVKWKSKDVKTHECPICHNHPVGYSHGWNCIGFAFACWHHGGGLASKCSDGVISNEVWEKILYAKTDAEALAIAQKHVGLKDLKVIRNKSGIPKSQWKAGDIMGKFNGSKYIHTYYYMGNGKIAESTGSSGKVPVNDQIRIKSYDKTSAKVIVRYLGK